MTDADDAYQFEFVSIDGKRLPLVRGAVSRCWSSTPPPFAATPRNTAISKRCGSTIAIAASSCSACRPTISARQEPGSAAEIKRVLRRPITPVDFPLTEKYRVIGGDAHPFYRWVAETLGEAGAPRWNFHKYLVGPDGQLAGAWPSQVSPSDHRITGEIERLLPQDLVASLSRDRWRRD